MILILLNIILEDQVCIAEKIAYSVCVFVWMSGTISSTSQTQAHEMQTVFISFSHI